MNPVTTVPRSQVLYTSVYDYVPSIANEGGDSVPVWYIQMLRSFNENQKMQAFKYAYKRLNLAQLMNFYQYAESLRPYFSRTMLIQLRQLKNYIKKQVQLEGTSRPTRKTLCKCSESAAVLSGYGYRPQRSRRKNRQHQQSVGFFDDIAAGAAAGAAGGEGGNGWGNDADEAAYGSGSGNENWGDPWSGSGSGSGVGNEGGSGGSGQKRPGTGGNWGATFGNITNGITNILGTAAKFGCMVNPQACMPKAPGASGQLPEGAAPTSQTNTQQQQAAAQRAAALLAAQRLAAQRAAAKKKKNWPLIIGLSLLGVTAAGAAYYAIKK